MDTFMEYFKSSQGFIEMLLLYIPLTCIFLSILITIIVRNVFVAPILFGILLALFFIYAYKQMNVVANNFVIAYYIYILISYLTSKLIIIFLNRKFKLKKKSM